AVIGGIVHHKDFPRVPRKMRVVFQQGQSAQQRFAAIAGDDDVRKFHAAFPKSMSIGTPTNVCGVCGSSRPICCVMRFIAVAYVSRSAMLRRCSLTILSRKSGSFANRSILSRRLAASAKLI